MVSEEKFHEYLISGSSQADVAVAALACLGGQASSSEVKAIISRNGVKADSWNLARAFDRAMPRVAKSDKLGAYQLTPSGKKWVNEQGLVVLAKSTDPHVEELRKLSRTIGSEETRAFLEECVSCVELGLNRAAVIMSWVAAVHLLKEKVFNCHRGEFDTELQKNMPRWKPVKALDDYSRIKESEFIEKLASISVIGKNTKTELLECLGRRNSCGHPNSLKLGTPTVAHHLDILMRNVFSKFSS